VRRLFFWIRFKRLNALYVHRIQTLRGLFGVERHAVSFVEVIEMNINKSIHVEEQILLESVSGNETESFLCELFDYSSH